MPRYLSDAELEQIIARANEVPKGPEFLTIGGGDNSKEIEDMVDALLSDKDTPRQRLYRTVEALTRKQRRELYTIMLCGREKISYEQAAALVPNDGDEAMTGHIAAKAPRLADYLRKGRVGRP